MLDVTGLSKSFGGLKAVTDAHLSVSEGQIVSLIGPNGAGENDAVCFDFGIPET